MGYVDSGHGPGRTMTLLAVLVEDDHWPAISLSEPGSDDSKQPWVPFRPRHDGALLIETIRIADEQFLGFPSQAVCFDPPVAVERIELRRKPVCRLVVISEKQVKRQGRISHAASGVEARR
jgi:hypothetical protein